MKRQDPDARQAVAEFVVSSGCSSGCAAPVGRMSESETRNSVAEHSHGGVWRPGDLAS